MIPYSIGRRGGKRHHRWMVPILTVDSRRSKDCFVALMSSGIKTATGLLWVRRWTTGKRAISVIILGMSEWVNS